MSSATEAISAPAMGTKLGGVYELRRFLGAGGMGAVYEVLGPGGEQLAAKVLLQQALRGAKAAQVVARFEREARVISSLASDHIVKVLHAGMDEALGLPFMVMPLLVGLDLQELLDRQGALHPALAARIVRQACRALAVAHAAAVIHRDIKPANLFLDHDPRGRVTVRVLDFGVASWRTEDTQLTRTGSMLGTPCYIAPEQVANAKAVSPRGDVWSLGMVLYQALAGQLPFREIKKLAKRMLALATQELPPLQGIAPWVEPGLAAVAHGALLLDVERRCPSVEALSAALAPYTQGSDDIDATMLQPLPQALGAARAAPLELPQSWSEVPVRGSSQSTFAVAQSNVDPLVGTTIADRYRLLRCLGEGGMGAVYEAATADGGRYAVKVIEPDRAGKDEVSTQRLVREAQAIMSIDSPRVVRVHEAGTDERHRLPYIVMELLRGLDLGVVIQRRGALSVPTVARLFVQACEGLSAAHALGFVHRDIKPANLFLQQLPSGEVVVKVCDFGLVKRLLSGDHDATTAQLTRDGGMVGSPTYMSPEQYTHNVDHRTDIWSLGISLFQALSGLSPWGQRDTVGEIIVAICTEPIPHLQDCAPWVPKALAEIVHRTLERDPDRRFQSAQALAEALLPFTGGSTVVLPADVVAVPDSLRAQIASRASIPPARPSGSGTTSVSGGSVAHSVGAPPPRYRSGALILGAAGALLVAGIGGFAIFRAVDGEPAAPAAAASLAPPQSAPPAGPRLLAVRVPVTPASAVVTVDGQAHELTNGELQLRGEAGQGFEVVVAAGAASLKKTVLITKDGQAVPAKLELPAAPVAARSPSSAQPKPKKAPPVGPAAGAPSPPPGKPSIVVSDDM